MYQGAGSRMVSRSHEARDSSTVLVGDAISGLVNTMMIRALAMVVMVVRTGMMYP